MKRVFARIAAWLAIGGLSVVSSAVVAEDFNRIVAAGKRTLIGSIGVYNTFSCTQSAIPQARVARRPAHGKVEVVEERRTISAGRCGRIVGNSLVIYYTPERGFRGMDRTGVDFLFFNDAASQRMRSTRYNFAVLVK